MSEFCGFSSVVDGDIRTELCGVERTRSRQRILESSGRSTRLPDFRGNFKVRSFTLLRSLSSNATVRECGTPPRLARHVMAHIFSHVFITFITHFLFVANVFGAAEDFSNPRTKSDEKDDIWFHFVTVGKLVPPLKE